MGAMPVFTGTGFGMVEVPVGVIFFTLCGLCTSVMWGTIFNLAVEGLGKYTSMGSGIFMVMVCGGGILPLIQGGVADFAGYLSSYWVIVAGLAYMLFYALIGSRTSTRTFPCRNNRQHGFHKIPALIEGAGICFVPGTRNLFLKFGYRVPARERRRPDAVCAVCGGARRVLRGGTECAGGNSDCGRQEARSAGNCGPGRKKNRMPLPTSCFSC